MKLNQDTQNQLRSTFAMREIESAKSDLRSVTGGPFVRVTLALVFMYLTVISYLVLGKFGPVFISLSFLMALAAPFVYRAVKRKRAQRKSSAETGVEERESFQEI